MLPVEIKKDIYWVGCVDFDRREFHGYSRSPDGTTYNAYLIKDKKNVLLDTVAPHWGQSMVERIETIMPLDKIDYIVCNHMELDHQGALAEIVERVKPEKIFVSQLGLQSLAGYFAGRQWPIHAVKSGETLDLGNRKIVFQETRMLHWPDSMVSYIPEEKLLVSNDIFGQNIASSSRFVDEYADRGDYIIRIKEYFYNIVLPYSQVALKTLPIVQSLDIDMIAPDHGLIHRGKKEVEFIINIYRELAEQKTKQRALIFYDTMWRSTENMAYEICSSLVSNGVPTRIMSVKSNHRSAIMTELADCGAVVGGSPTHNNGELPLIAALLNYMKGLKPRNRIGGAFGSFGWSGEAPAKIHRQLGEMGMETPVEPLKCNWSPDLEAMAACHAFGKAIAKALKKKCASEAS